MNRILTLLLFVGLSLGGGLVIGIMTAPGAWYAGLNKPFFNPPNWVFGPVWTLLYTAIGVAGWRVWRIAGSKRLQQVWWGQMGLNFLWSPVFFAAQNLGIALVIIILLCGSIVTFIALSRRVDVVSAWLFVPYLAWVSFATALNTALFLMN